MDGTKLNRRRVLAQRKFAQGAAIPASTTTLTVTTERRSDPPDRADRAPDHIVAVPLPASNLLDHVAFKNIHTHQIAGLKEVRVVLDRLPNDEPQRSSVKFLVPNAPVEKKLKQSNVFKRRMKLRSRSVNWDSEKIRNKERNRKVKRVPKRKAAADKDAVANKKIKKTIKRTDVTETSCQKTVNLGFVNPISSSPSPQPASTALHAAPSPVASPSPPSLVPSLSPASPGVTPSPPSPSVPLSPPLSDPPPSPPLRVASSSPPSGAPPSPPSTDPSPSPPLRGVPPSPPLRVASSLPPSGVQSSRPSTDPPPSSPLRVASSLPPSGVQSSRPSTDPPPSPPLRVASSSPPSGVPPSPPSTDPPQSTLLRVASPSPPSPVPSSSLASPSVTQSPPSASVSPSPPSTDLPTSPSSRVASSLTSPSPPSQGIDATEYKDKEIEQHSSYNEQDEGQSLVLPSPVANRPMVCYSTREELTDMNLEKLDNRSCVDLTEEDMHSVVAECPADDIYEFSDKAEELTDMKQKKSSCVDLTEEDVHSVVAECPADDVYEFSEHDVTAPIPEPYRSVKPDTHNAPTQEEEALCISDDDSSSECSSSSSLTLENYREYRRYLLGNQDSVSEETTERMKAEQGAIDGPSTSHHETTTLNGEARGTLTASVLLEEPQPSTSGLSAPTTIKRPIPSEETRPVLSHAVIREGQKFTPSAAEAKTPIQYAAMIKSKFPSIGICTVKLEDFKPPLILDPDQPTFNLKSQYISKLFERCSPTTRDLLIIKCSQQKYKMKTSPLFEGIELDLVSLYKYVQEYDGLKNVLTNDGWTEIIKKLRISSKGRPEKRLEKLYFKYLLAHETMTPFEREEMNERVSKAWEQLCNKYKHRAQNPFWRQERMMALEPYSDEGEIDDITKACMEAEECVTSNRTATLKQFRKNAERAKVVYMGDKPNPTMVEVEQQYWRTLMLGTEHVCVNGASVDTTEHGHGFPADINAPYGNHPWNLKRVCKTSENVLSCLENTLGITSPSLHYGMIFTTSCWHMDPHHMPWIEYLHEGPPKIWYSVPEDQVEKFRNAVSYLCPSFVQNKSIWLPADIVMVPPSVLRQQNITLDRVVQHAGEFVIVYPNTYSASIDTGMTISEGAYFAPHSWLQNCEHIFKEFRENCEPTMFSIEELLIGLSKNSHTPLHLLTHTHNVLQPMIASELRRRTAAKHYGLRMLTSTQMAKEKKTLRYTNNDECFYCRATIHFSRVIGVSQSGTCLCLEHGLRLYVKSKEAKKDMTKAYCYLHYANEQLEKIISSLQRRISSMASDWASNT